MICGWSRASGNTVGNVMLNDARLLPSLFLTRFTSAVEWAYWPVSRIWAMRSWI